MNLAYESSMTLLPAILVLLRNSRIHVGFIDHSNIVFDIETFVD